MDAYLIYHPKRQVRQVNGFTIYHDKFHQNQDPYIWNDKFLNTYCHTYRVRKQIGQVNFWVSGDTFPAFNHLYCDCVFEIAGIHTWTKQNSISIMDPIVEYFDKVLAAEGLIPVTIIAKDLGLSALRLNKILRDYKVQYKMGDTWVLFSKYQNMGFAKTKTFTYYDSLGVQRNNYQLYWTEVGRKFITDLVQQKQTA